MLDCDIGIPKLAIILVGALVCIFFVFSPHYQSLNGQHHDIYINISKKVFETDEKFLSLALDTSFMEEEFHKMNASDWALLEKLARKLSPGYLRLGGTSSDRVLFKPNDTVSVKLAQPAQSFRQNLQNEQFFPEEYLYISGRDWLKINEFAKKSELNLLFSLNVLLRNGSRWDSRNAESLLRFSDEHGLQMDFQLGNEPNSFRHKFHKSIHAKQLASDFESLREILSHSARFNSSKLIGPDVTNPRLLEECSLNYLTEFLENFVDVNGVSWHHYYFDGKTATPDKFLDPDIFDSFTRQVSAIKNTVRQFSAVLPIWLSETSSAFGGGAPGLSDRFIASFIWLDKLGLAAKFGIKIVIRQTLFKGDYSLVDKNYVALPDYWISLFYKLLVGKTVLDVKFLYHTEEKHLRLYAHCLKNNTIVNGNIILFGMNLKNSSEYVLPGGLTNDNFITSLIFTSPSDNLLSKTVLLNGIPLELFEDSQMYYENYFKFPSKVLPLCMPPYSIVFWIFHGAREGVCKEE